MTARVTRGYTSKYAAGILLCQSFFFLYARMYTWNGMREKVELRAIYTGAGGVDFLRDFYDF